jgi:hypothetical protein
MRGEFATGCALREFPPLHLGQRSKPGAPELALKARLWTPWGAAPVPALPWATTGERP